MPDGVEDQDVEAEILDLLEEPVGEINCRVGMHELAAAEVENIELLGPGVGVAAEYGEGVGAEDVEGVALLDKLAGDSKRGDEVREIRVGQNGDA